MQTGRPIHSDRINVVNKNSYNELKRKHLEIVCTPDVMCVLDILSVNKAGAGCEGVFKRSSCVTSIGTCKLSAGKDDLTRQ